MSNAVAERRFKEAYAEIAEGIDRVFECDERDEILKAMLSEIKDAEAVNASVLANLRGRSIETVRRLQAIVTIAGAGILLILREEVFKHVPAWLAQSTAGTLVVMAIVAIWALVTALHADRSLETDKMMTSAIVPFRQSPETAQSAAAYRMWVIPPRWIAVLRTEAELDKMGDEIYRNQFVFGIAFSLFILSLGLIAACFGTYQP